MVGESHSLSGDKKMEGRGGGGGLDQSREDKIDR